MQTLVLTLNPNIPAPHAIAQAAEVIRRGGLVAFPTETVYGLGADALSARAVQGIFAAKERPAYDPLIVHLATAEDVMLVAAEIPSVMGALAAFWPGPLTLVLPRGPRVPLEVTGGGETVAVRVPAHPVALALIRAAGGPIAAPSANRFGRLSPTCAADVLSDLDGRIDMLLDGGPTSVGLESTVLSLAGDVPMILRPGGVSREALEAVLGPVDVCGRVAVPGEISSTPGALSQHYAPRARMVLYRGPMPALLAELRHEALRLHAAGERVGILLSEEAWADFADLPVLTRSPGPLHNLEVVARALFSTLRAFDVAGVDVILAQDFGPQGLGLAIRDRLTRAAGGAVVMVGKESGADNARFV